MSTDGSPKPLKKATQDRLIRLKTKDEVQAADSTVDVYVLESPVKSVKPILDLVRSILATTGELPTAGLQHLRRVCTPNYLPTHLKSSWVSFPEIIDDLGEDAAPTNATPTMYLILCAASQITHSDLLAGISTIPESLLAPLKPEVRTIPVPEFAPLSQEQAHTWSARYWPTTFKNTNPHGAHPALVGRAEAEMLSGEGVAAYMQLAAEAAKEGFAAGLGPSTGAAAVERGAEHGARVVAVASDARWCGTLDAEKAGGGNPMGHAVMRLVGMVARKRLLQSTAAAASSSGDPASSEVLPVESDSVRAGSFLDAPLTPLERLHFLSDTLLPLGYLCLDLELYLTHEPCVMCSMAILHSRFGRVVFERQMAKTGALMADREQRDLAGSAPGELKYGLFWRRELNWKFLCWSWGRDDDGGEEGVSRLDDNVQA